MTECIVQYCKTCGKTVPTLYEGYCFDCYFDARIPDDWGTFNSDELAQKCIKPI